MNRICSVRWGLVLVCLLIVCLGARSEAAAKEKKPKKKKSDPSAEFFASTEVRTYNITVDEPPLNALKKDNRAYVRATLTEGTNIFKDVGIHLKGVGSFRPLNEKPSFVVKFDKYTPGQEYHGLSKFMLNNSSQDGTYLAELMATGLFRDAGLPAARVTHARVQFNGRDLGLYVLIEAMNKHFLERWFKNTKGNLYEVYLADIDRQMELDGGTDKTQADRKALVAATQIADPAERWSRLQEVLDVDRFLSFTALEMFTSHTDGYAMNRNNYRIYHDPDSGRFTFITHGLDWGFANPSVGLFPPMNSLVVKAVLQTPEGRRQYRQRVGQLFTNVFHVDVLTNRVNAAIAKLKAAARNPGEAKEFDNYGADMRNRIVARAKNIADQLSWPEPEPLKFDPQGVARLTGWRIQREKDSGGPSLDQPTVDDKLTLHINAGSGGGVASWRTRVLLEPGTYRFQGRVRTAQVVPQSPETGIGAGVRISGDKRTNKLTGDSGWEPLEHEIKVEAGGREVVLVCELRAAKGEAWFEAGSLKVFRKPE